VLEDFERRRGEGESLNAMEYSTRIDADGYAEYRYMKAIVMEPLCVTCHGQELSPALEQVIARHYPNDAATGFAIGDLRGAVYVVRRVRESAAK
jgi:hypothetical protein